VKAAALLGCVLLLAVPTPASADVIFDPADADELAAVLAEAYADQDVCYGWDVTVDNVGIEEQSVGSNFGAGKTVDSGSCRASVVFAANITYTAESSESEDSASYSVWSTPADVTSADLDSLDLDFDELKGENPDAVIGKAVVALPLLAADKGMAKPLSATPDTATAPADAQLTDNPGSDWWRDRGGMVIWALILMAASGVLIWAILRMNRRYRRRLATVPAYVPEPMDVTPEPESTEDRAVGSTEDRADEPPTAAESPADQADEPPAKRGEGRVGESAMVTESGGDRAGEPPTAAETGGDRAGEPPTAATKSAGDRAEAPATPATDAPATDAPATESPATESPASNSSAAESSAGESSAGESSVVESPAGESPADKPSAGESPVAESLTEPPVADSPAESPAAEDSAEPSSAAETSAGADQARPAPPDQKDKE